MYLNRHLLLNSFINFVFVVFLFFLNATTVSAFTCPSNTVSNCSGVADGTTCYLTDPIDAHLYCAAPDTCNNGNVENKHNACKDSVCIQYGGIWDTHQTCTPSSNNKCSEHMAGDNCANYGGAPPSDNIRQLFCNNHPIRWLFIC